MKIRSVEIVARNKQSGLFLANNGRWVKERTRLFANFRRNEDDFFYKRNFPFGEYRVEFRSTDVLGNRETNPKVIEFRVHD